MRASPLLRRSRRREARLLVALALFVAATLALLVWRTSSPDPAEARVARVVDGDTLLLEDGRRVRLLGVDTPETKHPERPPEPWGREATAFTEKAVAGRRIVLEFGDEPTDRYGRVLAWVRYAAPTQQPAAANPGDRDVARDPARLADRFPRLLNRDLVAAGLSPAVLLSPLRADYRWQLIQAEREAREARRALWSDQPPPEPSP